MKRWAIDGSDFIVSSADRARLFGRCYQTQEFQSHNWRIVRDRLTNSAMILLTPCWRSISFDIGGFLPKQLNCLRIFFSIRDFANFPLKIFLHSEKKPQQMERNHTRNTHS